MVDIVAGVGVFIVIVIPLSLVVWLLCAMVKGINLSLTQKELDIKERKQLLREESNVAKCRG